MTVARLCAALAVAAAPAFANDFPTVARVEYVLECMRESKSPPQEMVYKCSCAIDHIAAEIKYDAWVDLTTVALGSSIAGERGGVIRDMKDGRKLIARYRELRAQAKRACLIND